jgi:hypothetical protein
VESDSGGDVSDVESYSDKTKEKTRAEPFMEKVMKRVKATSVIKPPPTSETWETNAKLR